ncbi:uncharacterized mitochondrial protein AtMg00810-like [Spinacia oleracea]|uniref:Uncharacterized mitochondrial protein AtMg00810-like n=1 Tax=Spinacia oleracea TaxID=3562 RepID=A0ABM3RSR6_SPIOL|nr:uncharacterized mitochondrial protein AtMg00810-like [Spinacia oleracea]
MAFVIAKSDTSLFTFKHGDNKAYLLLYVDDIILCTSSDALCDRLISHLKTEFPISHLGPMNYFLGISVSRTPYMLLFQQKYAHGISKRADSVPPMADPTQYHSLACALRCLTFIRPDVAYAMQHVCLFMHDPREPHLYTLKRILRNIHGTIDHGLHIYPTSTLHLITYTDVD